MTANELHLVRGRTAVLKLTSDDVIHSFWAPRLGGKRDVIKGRVNTIVLTPDSSGTFLGQCAEFCGVSHANMRLLVMVDDSATFAAWATHQQADPAAPDTTNALLSQGAAAFRKIREPAANSCVACHAIKGISGGIQGPNLTHVGRRTTIAAGLLPATPDGFSRWLSDPPAVKPGSKMPKIGLTGDEVAVLAAYLTSLR